MTLSQMALSQVTIHRFYQTSLPYKMVHCFGFIKKLLYNSTSSSREKSGGIGKGSHDTFGMFAFPRSDNVLFIDFCHRVSEYFAIRLPSYEYHFELSQTNRLKLLFCSCIMLNSVSVRHSMRSVLLHPRKRTTSISNFLRL